MIVYLTNVFFFFLDHELIIANCSLSSGKKDSRLHLLNAIELFVFTSLLSKFD